MKLEYKPYTLEFEFDAGTSRGVMKTRDVWFLQISEENGTISGVGEVAPLWRLSAESREEVEGLLHKLPAILAKVAAPSSIEECYELAKECSGGIASIRFGLEMALIDYFNGGGQLWFRNDFVTGSMSIPINGLIWMNEAEHMKRQADEKLKAGFDCIKMKIGAIDFEKELEVLAYIRSKAPNVILRVDANGAFDTAEVLEKLKRLAEYDLHSIEQPILPRQPEAMNLICQKSKIPVALDEELIGMGHQKAALIQDLNPAYIILKPSLLGGFKETAEWINVAEKNGVGWWITSALESNIGLYAIAQFTAEYKPSAHQGLGTGSLFTNNKKSCTKTHKGLIFTIN